MITADYEERLRRLALHDEDLIGSLLTIHVEQPHVSGLDSKTSSLVRLGALVALDGTCVSYQWAVQRALAAGATFDEIVGALMAVTPITGAARMVVAVPELALAIGYDLDAAFEDLDGNPR